MFRGRRLAACLAAATLLGATGAAAQQPEAVEEGTRAAEIAAEQARKAQDPPPYKENKVEKLLNDIEQSLIGGKASWWHPWFESAYAGGSFTLGAGWARHVSAYNIVDFRGSYTILGYKRLEAEFLAPRIFDRHGRLSVIGGWREATQVGFYGFGTGNTSKDDRANYNFSQPYVQAVLDYLPTRRFLVLTAGLEYTQWDQSESDKDPSVEEVYTPETLPGLNASPTYLHTHARVGVDWRPGASTAIPELSGAAGYARSGGYYGVTVHSFADQDDTYSFRQVDYDAIQHLPILRDTWVLSLRGRVQTTYDVDDEIIPFFMMPALGGGSSLRGFSSWRFRDRHSLLLTAEWRVLLNRFLDMALFYDAGKVTARRSDLDFDGLKSDFGLGFRFHGPAITPLRIELAKSNEGLQLVFSAKAAF
jgi:hypothetical protein